MHVLGKSTILSNNFHAVKRSTRLLGLQARLGVFPSEAIWVADIAPALAYPPACHHADAAPGAGWTPSGCCSQPGCGHPPAACQQRSDAAGQGGYLWKKAAEGE
eukprot:scaffold55891_cov25-Tisochrysis_lutea.AAC.1